MLVHILPHVNAALNSLSTVLLLTALFFVRTGRRRAHRRTMIAAMAVSAVFLACYLTYHATAPVFVFPGKGWVRPVYYTMLVSHVILAVVVTPLIIMTAWRAFSVWQGGAGLNDLDNFARHRAMARWVLPIWLYVTVTGVVIYVTLYHVYAPA
jgi:putative membrane protein